MSRKPYMFAKEQGGGHSFKCFHINRERVPMLCLQQLDALEANNWTNDNIQ